MRVTPVKSYNYNIKSYKNEPIKIVNSNVNFEGKFFTKKGYYLTALLAGANVARGLFPNFKEEDTVSKKSESTTSETETANTSENKYPQGILTALITANYFDNKDLIDAKTQVLDKFYTHEEVNKNDIVPTLSDWIIREKNINNMENISDFTEFLLNNKPLYENKGIINSLSDIIFDNTDEDFSARNFKRDILKFYLETPELQQNKKINNNIGQIAANIDYQTEFSLAKFVLSKPELYSNNNIFSELVNANFNVDVEPKISAENSANAKQAILQLYLNNKDLQTNNMVANNIGEIVTYTESYNLDLAKAILSDERFYTNEELIENLSDILFEGNKKTFTMKELFITTKGADFIDRQDNASTSNILPAIDNENQLEFINFIADNKKLFEKPSFEDSFLVILNAIETKACKNLATKVLSTPGFYNKPSIIKGLSNLLIASRSNDDIQLLIEKAIDHNDVNSLDALINISKRLTY